MLSSFTSIYSQAFFDIPFVIASGAPINTAAPVASGTATVGSILSVTNGSWTGSPTGYSYQWNNGSDISGATASTYTVQAGDSGLSVYCKVTATNGVGSSTANSNSKSIGSVIVDGSGNVIVDESGNSILS